MARAIAQGWGIFPTGVSGLGHRRRCLGAIRVSPFRPPTEQLLHHKVMC